VNTPEVLAAALILTAVVGAVVFFFKTIYVKVDQGEVLVLGKAGHHSVTDANTVVLPIHSAGLVDVTGKQVVVELKGYNGLLCQDGLRAEIRAVFDMRINPTEDDILRVAKSLGCAAAGRQETYESLFRGKFKEALHVVGSRFDFDQLQAELDRFKEEVLKHIGRDLMGYSLEDLHIENVEQTPRAALDPDSVHDAVAIRKIAERTTPEQVRANQLDGDTRLFEKMQETIDEQQALIKTLDRALETTKKELLQDSGVIDENELERIANHMASSKVDISLVEAQQEAITSLQALTVAQEVEIAQLEALLVRRKRAV
jgi:uncharacterized membrane protein YqiK